MAMRHPHTRKTGPGRRHVQGNGKKTAKQRSAGSYGRGLKRHFDRQWATASAERCARKLGI